MSTSHPQQQVDIFADDLQQRHFAELCNALYERELQTLAQQSINSVSLLQRKLAGLSHHIKNAAEHLLCHQAPIEVDIHNASWQSKQAAKCVVSRHDGQKTALWFERHAFRGLAVPVYVEQMGQQSIELDSIDRVDSNKQLVHVNKHGWFYFSGEPQVVSTNRLQHKTLLLPCKINMIAACCGHTWNHRNRTSPRALSLREMLLSTTINWKTFR